MTIPVLRKTFFILKQIPGPHCMYFFNLTWIYLLWWQVHKVLLVATSDYFRAMLLGPMRESQKQGVDLKDLSSEALEIIMDFIYSGTIEFDYSSLGEILNAASHLQVQTALDLCSDYMISLLSFSNADELLPIADMYSLDKVMAHYSNKVLSNFEEFALTDQFLRLSAHQLCRYLADDNLKVKSERSLYDMVAKWYSSDQSRQGSLKELLKNIRFCLMSEVDLSQLREHWLTTQCLDSVSYFEQGLQFHLHSRKGHPWLSPSSLLRSKEPSLTLIHHGSAYRPFEITSYDVTQGRFYQLMTDISGSRDCRLAAVGNFLYMCRTVDCGGGALMNSLLRFDPRHLTLQELQPCRRLRIDPALTSFNGCLYVLGGMNEHLTIQDSVECYDIENNAWLDLLPLPIPTHSHTATVVYGMIYVCGGVNGQDQSPTASVYAYDLVSRTWQNKTPMTCARRLHESVGYDSRIYVMGGIGTHSYHQQTQIPMEYYETKSDQWTMLNATLAGRSIGHFLLFRDMILSIGREHYEAQEDDIWSYNLKTDTWKPFTKVPRRSLASTMGSLLHLNFYDEKISNKAITDNNQR